MTESTDQTSTTEDFTALTTDQLARLLTDRIQSYGGARDLNGRDQQAGYFPRADAQGAYEQVTDAVAALAARVPAEPTDEQRAAYVRTGLRLALDLATASGRVATARMVDAASPIGFGPNGYRGLLAAELAAMDALTAHLAAR